MKYNVSFIFEKPFRFYTTEKETMETVTPEEYDMYLSGNYIKGEDGQPKYVERIKLSQTDYATPLQNEILEAIVGIQEELMELRMIQEGSIEE